MNFRIDRAAFSAAVADAVRAVPSRPSAPVLNTVRITVSEDGDVEVVGYDFNVCIRATVPADVVLEPGVVCVSGRVLAAYLAGMPNGSLDVQEVGARLELRMPKVRYGMATVQPEDYPGLPPVPEAIGVLDAEVFTRGLAKTLVAARAVEGLNSISGLVHLAAEPDGLTLVATDRYTVAVTRIPWGSGGPSEEATVETPARLLADALKGMSGVVQLCIDESGVALISDERTFTARRSGLEYVTWRAIVERLPEPTTRVRVQAAPFAAAMGAAGRVVSASHTPVRLTVSADEGLTYDAASDDSDMTGEADVVEVSGDPAVVGVSPLFLGDALKVVGCAVAEIAFRGPHKPLTVVDPDNPDDVHVVMPVRLPSAS